jgi:hypothetical protein
MRETISAFWPPCRFCAWGVAIVLVAGVVLYRMLEPARSPAWLLLVGPFFLGLASTAVWSMRHLEPLHDGKRYPTPVLALSGTGFLLSGLLSFVDVALAPNLTSAMVLDRFIDESRGRFGTSQHAAVHIQIDDSDEVLVARSAELWELMESGRPIRATVRESTFRLRLLEVRTHGEVFDLRWSADGPMVSTLTVTGIGSAALVAWLMIEFARGRRQRMLSLQAETFPRL